MEKISLNSIFKKTIILSVNIIVISTCGLFLGLIKLIVRMEKTFTIPIILKAFRLNRYCFRGIVLFVFLSLLVNYSYSQELQRRALFGAIIQDINDSVKNINAITGNEACLLYKVFEGTSAFESGLSDGDVILKGNGTKIIDKDHFVSIISKSKENDLLELDIVRNAESIQITCKLKAYPKDTYDYADVVYDYFDFKGEKIRQIIIKPKGNGIFPTMFFIPGYTCVSIDNLGENNPYEKTDNRLGKARICCLQNRKVRIRRLRWDSRLQGHGFSHGKSLFRNWV